MTATALTGSFVEGAVAVEAAAGVEGDEVDAAEEVVGNAPRLLTMTLLCALL